jgi:mRNA interferase RelE/StbE
VSTAPQYAIEITSDAQRDLKKLRKKVPRSDSEAIDDTIQGLRQEPRPHGAIKLTGGKPPREYRIRVGDYRILYSINDSQRIVTIGRVKDRKDAY